MCFMVVRLMRHKILRKLWEGSSYFIHTSELEFKQIQYELGKGFEKILKKILKRTYSTYCTNE